MQNFDVFFKLHFDSPQISDDELNAYSRENIALLSAVPRFSATAAELLAAHTAYFGAISDEATNAAIQKGYTTAMESARKAVLASLSRHEGAIRSKFGQGSPEYLRFFPQGLTEYREATLANIDEKLTRLTKAFTDLGAQLDKAVVQEFTATGTPPAPATGVLPVFANVRQAQLAAKSATTASKNPSATSRAALEVACQVALLTVALDAAEKPAEERAELRRLFPQQLLGERAASKTVPREVPPVQ